jgi:Amt family ammonium transporter
MSLAVIGLFVLWLGWFGFNPGSTMSFDAPGDVAHILVTTNTAAIAAVITATATSWIFIGKPDLGMTINGCLAGLVGITAGCAYVTVAGSLIIGAIAGVVVVFAVILFDKAHIDDPVGATSVHLACGVLGTLFVGLFAKAGVTTLAAYDGLFYGGGFGLLGSQIIGILAVAAFTVATTGLTWLVLKKTAGIRVSAAEELEGLDIGEHGNAAYPDFAIAASAVAGEELSAGDALHIAPPSTVASASASVPPDVAIPVRNEARPGAKMTHVSIVTKQSKFETLRESLDNIGITGITVTNVLGYGMQKGHTEYYRGAPVETRLLPKVKVDIVICKVPVDVMVKTVKDALYTGSVGDGKIFIYDVENVVKVRTGEEGYDALQDE